MSGIEHIPRYLLLPLAILYGTAIWLRNLCFNLGILKSHEFEIPVIVVGNLKAGGTGKTPFTEFLIGFLSKKYKVALLSRGYKRNTKGFVLVNENNDVIQVGDEAYQVKNKFLRIIVAVDENRVSGIQKILRLYPDTEIVILDDAFQHRYVKPGMSFLLTEFEKPFFRDFLLPVGMLREYRAARKRAENIVITKCYDSISLIDRENFTRLIKPKPGQEIFFSSIHYQAIKPLWGNKTKKLSGTDKILLVTGIANPAPLIKYLKAISRVEEMNYPDHHQFTVQDLKKIAVCFQRAREEKKIILVTEKDAPRLLSMQNIPGEIRENTYVIPLSFQILFNENEKLQNRIIDYVEKSKTKR